MQFRHLLSRLIEYAIEKPFPQCSFAIQAGENVLLIP